MIDKTIGVYLGVNTLPTIVECTEGDTMWRWHFEVYFNSQRWTIPSGGTVMFTGKKADGNVFDMLETIENNEAVVVCDEQMTAAVGPAACVLRFLDTEGKTVASTPIVLAVKPNPQTQGPMSETVLSAYNEVLQLLGDAIDMPAKVTEWLDEHITQETGYVLDTSLTIAGAAADAKATGDAVNYLKSALDDVYDNNGVPAQNLTISDFTSQDCYKTNGQFQVFGGDWVSTEFVPCYGSTVKYKGYAFWSASIDLAVVAFFDVCKQMTHCVASSEVLSSMGNGTVSGEVSVQPGDYYVRVISYTSRVPDSYVVVSAGNLYSKLSVVDGLADAVGTSGIEIGYNDFTSDQILRENGTFSVYGEPWRSTDYVNCFGAKSVQYTATPFHGNGVNLVAYVAFFDKGKNLISFLDSSSFPSGYHVNQTGSADVPQNAYYVRIVGQDSKCRLSIESTGLEQFTAFKASDLKILCIGDSLTRGVINTDVDIIRESYPYWVGKTLSSYAANAGYPGGVPRTWWARKANYEQPSVNTDLVLIMFGTNGELTQNTLATDVEPYSNYADYADTSVGCYCKIIEWVMEQTSNHAQIILMTPPMSWATTGEESYAQAKFNDSLNSLPVIRAIAERYALPVIDVFYESGMNKFNGSVFRPNDGIHFGAKGYHKLGTFIARKVASMYSTFDVSETGTVIS